MAGLQIATKREQLSAEEGLRIAELWTELDQIIGPEEKVSLTVLALSKVIYIEKKIVEAPQFAAINQVLNRFAASGFQIVYF